MFHSACTMLCFCLFYNTVLLFGVKHMHYTLIQFSNYKKSSQSYLISASCLPLFQSSMILSLFDSINKTSPGCFHDFFLLSSSVHQYSTRQASQGDPYIIRKNSLQYGLKSIRYHGAKLWNTLPLELRNAPTKIMFKTKLKIHLLTVESKLFWYCKYTTLF